MSSDRALIALFYPSNLWQITILSQYFFSFVLLFDLFNLGPQKYKILNKAKDFRGISIKKIIFNDMNKNFILFSIILSLCLPLLFSLFSQMLLKIEIIYILSLLIFLISISYALSEKLHEVLFWLDKTHFISLLYLSILFVVFLFAYFANIFNLNFLFLWLIILLSITFLKFFGLYYLLKIS
jgi:hypothetical protein